MRRTSQPRGRRSAARVVALAAALAAPGIAPVARGQEEPPARPAEGANPPAEAPAPTPAPGPRPNPYGVPGPEVFVKPPETPLELWDAVDYLVRTGQVQQAVPYLNALLKKQPDDATLLQIRDRYGAGSILRLDDYPETKAQARVLVDMLAAASRRSATRPERLARYIDALTKSPEEQQYAVERLREAGPYAVPALVEALQREGLDPEARRLIARNMGRLDRAAVPPLIATLDGPDPQPRRRRGPRPGRRSATRGRSRTCRTWPPRTAPTPRSAARPAARSRRSRAGRSSRSPARRSASWSTRRGGITPTPSGSPATRSSSGRGTTLRRCRRLGRCRGARPRGSSGCGWRARRCGSTRPTCRRRSS